MAKEVNKNNYQTTFNSLSKSDYNKMSFVNLEAHWATARLDYLRELPLDVKKEIERIYREEIDAGFFANYYCSACFLTIIKNLIKFYGL